MEKAIDIRKVEICDINTLAYIQTESWKSAFNEILSKEDLDKYTDINKVIELYDMLLNEDIANGFILTIDGKPHCISYWDKARDEKMEGYAEVICIHSLCDNWGKGYGKIMMDFILKDIKNSGFNKVMLWVFKENSRARKFYENNGFTLTDKTQKFDKYIEVMYCRDL